VVGALYATLQDADELGSTGRDDVVLPHLDPMAHAPQLLHLALRDAPLDKEAAILVTVAGMVDGLLRVHAVI
jgi:hypothetical protein